MDRRRSIVAFMALVLLVPPAPGNEPAPEERGPDPGLRLSLLAPFATPRDTLFYSGFGVPLLRQARVPPPGTLDATLRTSRTHLLHSGFIDGNPNRIDALHLEHLRLGLRLAVHERVAVWTEAQVAGWDERRDRFDLHSRGTPEHAIEGEEGKAVFGQATGRHDNLALVTLGALVDLWQGDDGVSALGLSIQLKSPGFRRGDVTNSGTFDVAATLHASFALHERVVLHGHGGLVVPIGDPWIFEDGDAFEARPFAQGAIGVTWAPFRWLALGASLDAVQSPWEREVRFIDRPALTAAGGARLLLGRFSIEVGGGAGLTSGSADWLFWVELGYTTRPLW